jgi:hypothetical protein
MKNGVFLRHSATRLYYAGWHNWNPDVEQAIDFGKPEDAIQRAKSEMLSNVEVVMQEAESGEETVKRIVDPAKWL